MGKDVETKKTKKQQLRHQPLAQQIKEGEDGPKKQPRTKRAKKDDDQGDQEIVGSTMTKKILGLTRTHAREEVPDDGNGPQQKKKISFSRSNADEDDEEEEFSDNEEDYNAEELEEITEEDERALAMFMPDEAPRMISLADIIMAKIKEKESGMSDQINVAEKLHSTLNPKIIEVYSGIGKMMSKYSSGKLPKAFKIIPTLNNWEEILFITDPEHWSPPSTYQATRIFVSNLNAKMVQRYLNSVLYPKVLDDILRNKKLNFHYMRSLKKAVQKPDAFFKGIILPLCESNHCNVRCAVIFSSLLSKVSIPVLHSAVAILKIAEMPYSGTNSYFLSVLLNKKYALPFKVIDGVAEHFASFLEDKRVMHVVWQRAMLTFVQRYKNDLLPQQKAVVQELTRRHYHSFFSEEIRRELENSLARGEAPAAEGTQAMEM